MIVVFPNVEDEVVRGIRILDSILWKDGEPPGERLEDDVATKLGLWVIAPAIAALELPVQHEWRHSWRVLWSQGSEPTFNGRSAQFAALLAALWARLREPEFRGWMRGEEIWATGGIDPLWAPYPPALRSVGDSGKGHDDLNKKFDAFVNSRSPAFFCASSDAKLLANCAGQSGLRVLDLAGFENVASAPRCQGERYLVAVLPTELRRLVDLLFVGLFKRGGGYRVANMVTASRLLLGGVAAHYCCDGNFVAGAIAYFLGLVSDIVDGAVARRYHGTSEFGKQFDRWVDMGFNVVAAVGYLAGALLAGASVQEIAGLLLATAGVMGASRLFVKPHSALAKLRSGWIRVVLLGFLLFRIGDQLHWVFSPAFMGVAIAAGLVLGYAAVIEIRLVTLEIKWGRRGCWTAKPRKWKRPRS